MNTNETGHRAAFVLSDLHDRFSQRVDALADDGLLPDGAMRTDAEHLASEMYQECDVARRSLFLLPWDETVAEVLAAVERMQDSALVLVHGLRRQSGSGSHSGDGTNSQA